MARHVDALTSATLKNLREQWWDSEFSGFLQETLRPRPGNRILDVGCGEGTAEMSLGRLRVSQLALFAIDRNLQRVARTAAEGRSHNYRLQLAGADVSRLPFTAGAFDATFCVAVLQHVNDVPQGRARAGARHPDRRARARRRTRQRGAATGTARRRSARGVRRGAAFLRRRARGARRQHGAGRRAARLGHLRDLRHRAGVGAAVSGLGDAHRPAAGHALAGAPTGRRARAGRHRRSAPSSRRATTYLETLAEYEEDASAAGANFVEIQNTMLFATVGQRTDAPVHVADAEVLSARCWCGAVRRAPSSWQRSAISSHVSDVFVHGSPS